MEPMASPDETSVLIMGHRVAFPAGKSPFPAQLAVMSSTLSALKRKQHALVESPTGSGKTLALLSSCLTFQRDYMQEAMANFHNKRMQQQQQLQQLRAQQQQQIQQQQTQTSSLIQLSQTSGYWDDDAFGLLQRSVKRFKRENGSSPIVNITNTLQSAQLTQQETQELELETHQETLEVKQEIQSEAVVGPDDLETDQPPSVPKIYFCSRTHSQLAQAVKELEGCPESYMRVIPGSMELKSCVLAAKRMLCVNEEVNNEPMLVNEKCQELRMEKERRRMAGDEEDEGGCQFSQTSFSRLRAQAPQIWDIEDVTKLASTCEECAYFFSKSELETAHIVFCPYNYVLDPSIRKAVGISLQNAIVVLDEAHNVEDTCRNGASLEITDKMLASAIKAFDDVIWQESESPQVEAYDAVRRMLSCVETWFETNAELARDPEDIDDDDCHVLWSTEDALEMLRECKFLDVSGADIAEIAQHEHMKLMSPGTMVMLGNRAFNTATRLISVAAYMFSNNCKNADDFKLLITKKIARVKKWLIRRCVSGV